MLIPYRVSYEVKPQFRLATFVGRGASGCAHSVFIVDRTFDALAIIGYSLSTDDIVVILVRELYGSSERYSARFYQRGREIRRCGSGTIAAAEVIRRVWGIDGGDWSDHSEKTVISTGVEHLRLLELEGLVGFESWPLHQTRMINLRLWQGLIDRPVTKLVLCGGERDYVIAELADENAVSRAWPDLKRLATVTRRALIITARAKRSSFVFRFFAPQYGVNEADVSGAACVQLLRYWYRQRPQTRFFARQLSPGGAQFFGVAGPGRIRIFGRVGGVRSPAQ